MIIIFHNLDLPYFPTEALNSSNNQFAFNNGEGEYDDKLYQYFVMTKNIRSIVSNIEQYPFVIAPKGVGKSALCNIITQPRHRKVINGKNYFFMLFNDYREIIDNYKNEIGLEYHLTEHILKRIGRDLKNRFSINLANYPEFEKMLTRNEGWILDNVVTKGKVSAGMLSGEIEGTYKNTKISSENICSDILCNISDFLSSQGKKVIICIDGIDDAISSGTEEHSKLILNALYETVKFVRKSRNIVPILFMRDDLFRAINTLGEKDKLRFLKTDLNWNKNELLELILKRLLYDENLKDIRKSIKYRFLFSKHRISIRLNSKDLSWIEKLSYPEKLKIFHLFFPKEAPPNLANDSKNIGFYEWIIKIFSNTKGVINVRNAIYFFKTLFEEQYDEFENAGVTYIDFLNGEYNIFCPENIEKALHKVQQNLIEDYADLIAIKNKSEASSLIEFIVFNIDANKHINLKKLDYHEFGFSEEKFFYLIEKLEFYGCIERKHGMPMNTEYFLAPIFNGYSNLIKKKEGILK